MRREDNVKRPREKTAIWSAGAIPWVFASLYLEYQAALALRSEFVGAQKSLFWQLMSHIMLCRGNAVPQLPMLTKAL